METFGGHHVRAVSAPGPIVWGRGISSSCLPLFRCVGDHCTILLISSADLGSGSAVSPPDAQRSSSGTPDYHTPSPDELIPLNKYVQFSRLCLYIYLFIYFIIIPFYSCRPGNEPYLTASVEKERSKSVDIALLPSFAGDTYDDFNQHGLTRFSPFPIQSLSNNRQ